MQRSAKETKRVWSVLKSLTHANSNSVTKLLNLIPPGPRLGNKVVEVEGISKSFDGRVLYENLSFHRTAYSNCGYCGVQTVRVKPHYSV